MTSKELLSSAKDVLALNDHGTWTQPAPAIYPNQWLWDSCFIAIGLCHYNPERAIREMRTLFAGQWQNGMVPHQVFHSHDYRSGARTWQSDLSPLAPPTTATSGITQPPLLAEAIWRIGEKLSPIKRKKLFEEFFPKLVAHHEWLYRERNPHGEGLVLLVHPWESGMDDSPPWVDELRYHHTPLWISTIEKLRVHRLLDVLRQDVQQSGLQNRMSTLDALRLFDVVRRMKRKKYESNQILRRALFSIEDLCFNSILIRNNAILQDISRSIRTPLPKELRSQFTKATKALETLWDPISEQYFSRNFSTGEFLANPTVATLLPLYSRAISPERAKQLVATLNDKAAYATPYALPTVPKSSTRFRETHYWQGPVWLNINWLIIDGLTYYGFTKEAALLRKKSIAMIKKSGFREYFSPIDGHGAGAADFAWTAALTIDLLENKKQ